jgi:predicted RNase H-like nuclease
MNNLEKDIELTLLKEKMEHMKEQRRVAVRKYMKKLRETDESFREKEKIRKKWYEDHREEILQKQKNSPNKDQEKDKKYYAKLKERMEADSELKQKVLEDQRRRGKIYRELLKAKKMAGQLEQITENKEVGLQLL